MKFSSQFYKRIIEQVYISRKLTMAANLKFELKTDNLLLKTTDQVCVSGDVDQLGNWKLEGRLPLKLVKDSKHGSIWQGEITFPSNKNEILFRYVIVSINNGQLMVRFWESNLKPREANKNETKSNETVHQFGFYDGKLCMQQGWLLSSNILQLKCFNNFVTFFDQAYQDQSFNIKVVKINGEDCEMDDQILITALNRKESNYSAQSSFGRKITNGDNIVFQTESLEPDCETFRIEFYAKKADDELQIAGIAYIPPNALKDSSTGFLSIPITGVDKQLLIGEIKMEYVIVRPLKTYDCDLKNCYVKYWKKRGEPLKIGHRGCGSSFGKIEKSALFNFRENTIGSLKMAGNNGADYVEFDVQLSRDLVPIIYHDFYLCAAVKSKNASENAKLLKLPVKELTLDELQNMKIYHVTEKDSCNQINAKTFLRDEEEEFFPFPTLDKLFNSIDTSLGFNVEIKWGLRNYAGVEDLPNQIDMNTYLDVILKTVLENAGSRRIVFSCFHPDVCTMIRWKQNKYPVLLLTQGKTRRYAPQLDPRTNCIDQAINFALSTEILGIDVQTEEILTNNSAVASCLDSGLLMFCWGADNNDPKNRELLKKLGVHAIIHDRVDQMKP